ncbi:hypothetical protein MKSMC1_32160 [Mycobacterium kansasii]|nr:hypothetical protein MKSMC1_32160 [Mycobacterium kansasii]
MILRRMLGMGKLPSLSINYKTAIPEAVLSTIPRRSPQFAVARQWVLRAVGVPAPRRS